MLGNNQGHFQNVDGIEPESLAVKGGIGLNLFGLMSRFKAETMSLATSLCNSWLVSDMVTSHQYG